MKILNNQAAEEYFQYSMVKKNVVNYLGVLCKISCRLLKQ